MKNTNATLILTEWNEFRNLDFDKYDELNGGKYFCDCRNIYNKQELTKKGFKTYR
ncbi:UDP binding domain-containing protein [Priestia aryabhattai]|uniref:UDP binding domain-containing protein n=1 Tax=Priestia megaterium TaxID=1404 RepID=UPI0039B8B9AA